MSGQLKNDIIEVRIFIKEFVNLLLFLGLCVWEKPQNHLRQLGSRFLFDYSILIQPRQPPLVQHTMVHCHRYLKGRGMEMKVAIVYFTKI